MSELPGLNHIDVEGGRVGSVRLSAVKESGGQPLVFINGGPGGTFLDGDHPIRALTQDRDVILYDQLGCYHSPAAFDISMTPMQRFTDELRSVLDFYGIEKAVLLGHSFGGAIAADFALAHPERTAAAIFSSPLLSTPHWIRDARLLLSEMPEQERSIIRRKLDGEPVSEEEYIAAENLFYSRHVCRLTPWPDRVLEGFSKSNGEIYRMMWGISEFTCTGTLQSYDRMDDLKELNMPCLFTCGRYDEARPETIAEAASRPKHASFTVFENSSHMPIWEQPEEYIGVMRNFARAAD